MDKKSKGKAIDSLLGKLEGKNAFGTPTLRSKQVDPLNMKRKMTRGSAIKSNVLAKHRGGTYSTGENVEFDDEDQDKDLKDNLEFVNENKFKTMDWTEPDGSKTKLKFDENGTLLGKKTR